jgi:hypothetical protein
MHISLINMYDKIKIDLIPIEVNNLTVNKLPNSTVSGRVNDLPKETTRLYGVKPHLYFLI